MSRSRWKLADEEYEFIKGEICHIFTTYKVKCVPVSGFEIASKMRITLVAYSGLTEHKLHEAMNVSEDGFFIEDNGHEYIFYNDIERDYKRQNWTILHELGHIVLDHMGNGEHEEDEANFFAKYAIAPPVLVHRIGAKSAYDIYRAFDVSKQAAQFCFEYYLIWKSRYEKTNELEEYDKGIIALYKKSV